MLKRFLFLAILITCFLACTENDDNASGTVDNFDRSGMLTNIADNTIIPALEDLDAKLKALVSAKDAFTTTPSQNNLDNLRASWKDAYLVWQSVEMFNIGKAEEIQYGFQMNVYPANISDIENNISSGSYDLTIANNNDAVGFPAVDYMIYGLGIDDQEILATYTTAADASKYRNYLSDIINQMETLTNDVLTDWTTSFRSEFVTSTQNTASSAVNKLVNDYIFYFEKGLRANKIGIPAGVFSTNPLPEKVEALYNKEISKELALESLQAVQNFFNGRRYNSNSTGISLSTYLLQLNKADLSTQIDNQFDIARERLTLLNNNLATQVIEENSKMTLTFDALQASVVLLKVDMLQAFNISVDFVDADGD